MVIIIAMDEITNICRRAEKLLVGTYPVPIRLDVLEQFESSHTVLRCAVSGADVNNLQVQTPQTVIVKQRALQTDQPRAPQDFDQSLLFLNEWASLDFLSSLSSSVALSPRLYASDRKTGLVILQDLGNAKTVQEALYSPDRQTAVGALVGIGKTIGQIQRMTYSHEADFLSRQATLATVSTTCDSNRDLRNDLDDFHACLTALGIPIASHFDTSMHHLENAIRGPGVFQTFLHHDAGPHNFVITPSAVQLLDFEFAGYGHGLLDIVCARLAFPPAFRGRIIPPEVIQLVEETYRLEVAAQVPAMNDPERFNEAVAQACAHWAFSKLVGFWNPYLRERLKEGEARDTRAGKSPERSAFLRKQVFTYLRLALATLEQYQQLPELHETLSQIVAQLLNGWPDTPLLSTYPAFGGEPWQYP